MGNHDDLTNVPDKDLPWCFPTQAITSAAVNHVGQSPTGILEGSTVSGMWGDSDRTHAIWHGPMARSTIQGPTGNQVPQTYPNTPDNDIAHNARGTQKLGVPGEKNLGKDWILQVNNSSWGKAEDASTDKNVLYAKPKFSKGKTIASKAYKGDKILNLIAQDDPGNQAGAIPSALQVMTGLKNTIDAGASLTSSILGGSNIGSLFGLIIGAVSQVAQSSQQGQNQQAQQNQAPPPVSTTTTTTTTTTINSSHTVANVVSMLMTNASSIAVVGGGGPGGGGGPLIAPSGGGTTTTTSSNGTTTTTTTTTQTTTTPQNPPQSAQGNQGGQGGGGGGGGIGSALGAIAGALSAAFAAAGGDTGGLGSFDVQQGVVAKLEGIFAQLTKGPDIINQEQSGGSGGGGGSLIS